MSKDKYSSIRSVMESFEESDEKFIVSEGELLCAAKTCEGCKFIDDCEFEEVERTISPQTTPRAMVGMPMEEYLWLEPKDKDFHKSIDSLTDENKIYFNCFRPREALDNQDNLHWLMVMDVTNPFKIIKGRCIWESDKASFEDSIYSKDYTIYSEYKPRQRVVAIDYSAIEPRVLAIVSQTEEYKDIFNGKPKIFAHEIELKEK